MIPPEMADRLGNLIAAVPALKKRDVVLTGLEEILEVCEQSMEQPPAALKLGAFESRGRTSFGFRLPIALDERLTNFVNCHPGVSRRDVALAGIDLFLRKCEVINGGPFPSPKAKFRQPSHA